MAEKGSVSLPCTYNYIPLTPFAIESPLATYLFFLDHPPERVCVLGTTGCKIGAAQSESRLRLFQCPAANSFYSPLDFIWPEVLTYRVFSS